MALLLTDINMNAFEVDGSALTEKSMNGNRFTIKKIIKIQK